MCTVLLRLAPSLAWPVLLGAVRDEFVERPWDPPDRHWDGPWSGFLGGRDQQAGGTWLAVDPRPGAPAVAAVLNGGRRDPLPDGAARPTRGHLPLRALAGEGPPAGAELAAYDCFHLLLATARTQTLWSWDGDELRERALAPGCHVVVNGGLDQRRAPLVAHVLPRLEATDEPDLEAGDWAGWVDLLAGDGLPGDDDRALLVERVIDDHRYGSTSAALVGLAADGRVRYEFSAAPGARRWRSVLPDGPRRTSATPVG